MKKRMAVLLAAAGMLTGIFGLTGNAEEEENFTVGICQFVQHQALDSAAQGFKDALTEALGERVTFVEENARGVESQDNFKQE
ncbi:MAG: hypothetical protein Q4F41_05025 [Eubacteriales bacterium]|nr:hypothetical protein [Eubacteriales bacterium]